MKLNRSKLALVGLATSLAVAAFAATTTGSAADGQVTPVLAEHLPNVPGKTLTAVLVTYPPAGKSAAHHHAGSVFAYVLSGRIRSEVSTLGRAKVYYAGESFFEPPGSQHLVSENASETEPASLLAVFVADDGAELTKLNE
jgi:quercetin dioxygenase-like cupin family protein